MFNDRGTERTGEGVTVGVEENINGHEIVQELKDQDLGCVHKNAYIAKNGETGDNTFRE